jgi:hypothetical protein
MSCEFTGSVISLGLSKGAAELSSNEAGKATEIKFKFLSALARVIPWDTGPTEPKKNQLPYFPATG